MGIENSDITKHGKCKFKNTIIILYIYYIYYILYIIYYLKVSKVFTIFVITFDIFLQEFTR